MKILLIFVYIALEYEATNGATIPSTTPSSPAKNTTTRSYPQMQVTIKPPVIDCPYEPICTCNMSTYQELSLFCTNFNDFTQLNFTNTRVNSSSLIFKRIRIVPKRPQELDENNLNLEGLVITSSGTVEIANINKFYFKSNPLGRLKVVENRFTTILELINCTFEFFHDANTRLNSVCGSNLLTDGHTRIHSLMSSANFIRFVNPKFVEPICPLVFDHVRAANFKILNPQPGGGFRFLNVGLDDTLVEANSSSKDHHKTTILNSRLKNANFENITLKSFDSSVLNKYVFYNIEAIWLTNVRIESLDEKVFANFPYLKEIRLKLSNWNELVERVNLGNFFRHLNANPQIVNFEDSKTKVDLKSKITIFLDGTSGNYEFPDTDFCKFVDFPFDLLVRPLVFTPTNNCTCTVKFLNKYAPKYPNDQDYARSAGSECGKRNDCDLRQLELQCRTDLNNKQEKLSDGRVIRKGLNGLTIGLISTSVVVLIVIILGIVYRRRRTNVRRSVTRRRSKQSDNFEMSTNNEQEVFDLSTVVNSNYAAARNTSPKSAPKLSKKSKNRSINT